VTAAIADHLWQSTLCAAGVGLLAAYLRGNRARVRYTLWLAASIKFLAPFSLLIALGSQSPWRQTGEPGRRVVPLPVSIAAARVAEPFAAAFRPPSDRPLPGNLTRTLAAIWAIGFASLTVMRLRGWRHLRAALAASTPASLRTVGIETQLPIRSSAQMPGPGVVGCWRPVLLVPAGTDDDLTPPQWRAVVAHELCHAARRDNLTSAIHMIVETFFWFHPAVWWIGGRLVVERERACDEHVVRIADPREYAEGILRICRRCVESPVPCVAGIAGSDVKTRIEDIMAGRIGVELNRTRRIVLALAAVLAVVIPLAVGALAPAVRAQASAQPRTQDPSGLVRTKEVVLRYALFSIRGAIDAYHARTNRYPATLESLVSAGYLVQIPADPFTNRVDSWRTVPPSGAISDVFDVRSGSGDVASDGTTYAEW
jgi:beta-lactamase regulating signal transducer with metallopeptidase domain